MLYSVIVCNAIALSAPTAFLPEMVERRLGYTSDEAAAVVGILSGAFSFAQFCSSFIMGFVSDRVGRKPLLLLGLGVSGALLAVFGFSGTLWCVSSRARVHVAISVPPAPGSR